MNPELLLLAQKGENRFHPRASTNCSVRSRAGREGPGLSLVAPPEPGAVWVVAGGLQQHREIEVASGSSHPGLPTQRRLYGIPPFLFHTGPSPTLCNQGSALKTSTVSSGKWDHSTDLSDSGEKSARSLLPRAPNT